MVELVFPPPTNATTFLQKIQYIDSLTDVGFGGVLGMTFLLVIFGALFLIQKAFAVEKAFAVSMFITSVLSVILGAYGLVADKIIYIGITGFVVSLFLLIYRESQGGF